MYTLSLHLTCLQGFGGPCCARILTSWFATKERGTYWGMWNIAHNLGGFAAPILAGSAARSMGWKWGEHPAPCHRIWHHSQLSCGGLLLLASVVQQHDRAIVSGIIISSAVEAGLLLLALVIEQHDCGPYSPHSPTCT